MQAVVGGAADFLSAAIQARERNRHLARPIARRSVGSTLLLKGLEADVSVVLHPELMPPPESIRRTDEGRKACRGVFTNPHPYARGKRLILL